MVMTRAHRLAKNNLKAVNVLTDLYYKLHRNEDFMNVVLDNLEKKSIYGSDIPKHLNTVLLPDDLVELLWKK